MQHTLRLISAAIRGSSRTTTESQPVTRIFDVGVLMIFVTIALMLEGDFHCCHESVSLRNYCGFVACMLLLLCFWYLFMLIHNS